MYQYMTIKKYKDERNFSYVFSIFFLVLALFPILNDKSLNLDLLITSGIFLLLGMLVPSVFILPNKIWIKFGLLLGIITTPIALTIMYLIGILPIALIFKLFGRDILNEKIQKNYRSYWVKRVEQNTDFNKQF